MKSVAEMDLPEIDMFDPEYMRDPHSFYAEARKKSWIAKHQFGYLLLDYDDMKAFMRDDENCRELNRDIVAFWEAQDTPFDRFTSHQLVAQRGADHKRLRDLIAPAFTPRAANKHREFMRKVINQILDEHLEGGKCDFNTISSKYPITVMCSLIGVDAKDVSKFAGWLEPMEAAFGMDKSILPAIDDGIKNMYEYVTDVVAARRTSNGEHDDLLQDLINVAADDGDTMSEEELLTMLILLLGGGYDTTKNQLNLIFKLLMDRPEQIERLQADPDYLRPFINEAMRFFATIGSVNRLPDRDIVYRDAIIPANSFVGIPLTFSGRDHSKYENPNEFDADRKGPPHLAFGQGIHICPGKFLATALLEEAIPIIVDRIKNPRLDGEPAYRSPLGIWGFTSLPIAYDED